MNKLKCYSELIRLNNYEDRLNYLRLNSKVGEDTFGFDRYINQQFYKSKEWKKVRDLVIVRDRGCDMGLLDREIYSNIIVHHMNPITVDDIANTTEQLLNPEYLITVSLDTHNMIHYGIKEDTPELLINRVPNDTCPWK